MTPDLSPIIVASPGSAKPQTAGSRLLPIVEARRIPELSRLDFDLNEETDVWYGGYSGRVMLGSLFACLIVTGGVLGCWWQLGDVVSSQNQATVRLALGGAVGAVWLSQLFRWGYRKLFYGIRLTNRRLFFDRGFLYPTWQVGILSEVVRVENRWNLWERMLGIGRVYLFSQPNTEKPVILPGVSRPSKVVDNLRRLAAKAREGQVATTKVAV